MWECRKGAEKDSFDARLLTLRSVLLVGTRWRRLKPDGERSRERQLSLSGERERCAGDIGGVDPEGFECAGHNMSTAVGSAEWR